MEVNKVLYKEDTMKILITGASGFLGRNLIERLNNIEEKIKLIEYNSRTPYSTLEDALKDCDFVYNFAAVHRPQNPKEFDIVNHYLFGDILKKLEENGNACPVLYTSSIQAGNNTAYGNSKIAAEIELRKHAEKMNSRGIIYRLTNIFGKWARTNSHSVVATFCYNITRDIPIVVNNPNITLNFYYIDEVIDSFVERLFEGETEKDKMIYKLSKDKTYFISLSELANKLYFFRDCENNQVIPQNLDKVTQYLYNTYCFYLPTNDENKN